MRKGGFTAIAFHMPRNNLQEQIERHNANKNTPTPPAALQRSKTFNFQKLGTAGSTTPLTRGFAAQFKPSTSNPQTLTKSLGSHQSILSRPPPLAITNQSKVITSTPHINPAPVQSVSHQATTPISKITSFFDQKTTTNVEKQASTHNLQPIQCSPPVARVAPVVSSDNKTSSGAEIPWDDCRGSSSMIRDTSLTKPALANVSNLLPPGSSLASTITTPSHSTHTTSKADLELKLKELHSERYQLMDEVCELFAAIPEAQIKDLFGYGAYDLLNKLDTRKTLMSQESELKKMLGSPYPSPQISQQRSDLLTSQLPPSPLLHVAAAAPLSSTPMEACNPAKPLPGFAIDTAFDDWDMSGEDAEIFDGYSDEEDFMKPTETSTSHPVNQLSHTTIVNQPTTSFMPHRIEPMLQQHSGASSSLSVVNQPTTIFMPHRIEPMLQQHGGGASSSLALQKTARPLSSSSSRDLNQTINHASYKPTKGAMPDNSAEFRTQFPHTQKLFKIFTQVFGLKQFRPNQLEAVNAVVLGKDCFVLMPTGGGKSLCYQLPALVTPGVTVVVSPLRSLILDQVQKLCSLEIPARYLSGDIFGSEESAVYASLSLKDPTTKLLYVTPEKLGASNRLLSALQGLYARQMLARFVIDEAHCISQWGHDFRPDYKKLCELRRKFSGVPFLALTATATPRVRADILHQLYMNDTKWFTQSFNRTNLQYSVVPKKPKKIAEDVINLISKSFRDQSGIVYCFSRRDCEVMADELSRAGIAALCYHAGLSDEDRTTVQLRWVQEDHCKVVCATIAFGMGIDKPDVRFVIHHSLPKSMEGYYQEAGRAGRDGHPAACFLFYSYSDMARIRRMVQKEKLKKEQERIHMENLYRMVQYAENEADCRRVQLLEYFAEKFDASICRNGSTPCDNCNSKVPYNCENVTALAKVVVEGVHSVGKDKFTLVQLLDALKGSNASKIVNSELGSLALYGKGQARTKHDLERLLHKLVMEDYLSESLHIGSHDNVICYVKTGSKANVLLCGRAPSIMLNTRGKPALATTAKSSNKSESKEDKLKQECYKELLKLRMTIAQEYKIKNPEHVFNNATLHALKNILPTTKPEMMGAVGMTEIKYSKFSGQRMLELTQEYATKLASIIPSSSSSKSATHSPYWGGPHNGENQPPCVGKGKRKKTATNSGPPLKKQALMRTTSGNTEDDEFEAPTLSLRKPGLMPPPKPNRNAQLFI